MATPVWLDLEPVTFYFLRNSSPCVLMSVVLRGHKYRTQLSVRFLLVLSFCAWHCILESFASPARLLGLQYWFPSSRLSTWLIGASPLPLLCLPLWPQFLDMLYPFPLPCLIGHRVHRPAFCRLLNLTRLLVFEFPPMPHLTCLSAWFLPKSLHSSVCLTTRLPVAWPLVPVGDLCQYSGLPWTCLARLLCLNTCVIGFPQFLRSGFAYLPAWHKNILVCFRCLCLSSLAKVSNFPRLVAKISSSWLKYLLNFSSQNPGLALYLCDLLCQISRVFEASFNQPGLASLPSWHRFFDCL